MQRNENQLKQAWQTYHREFEVNILPVGHEKLITLAFEAHTDPNLKVKLADYFEVAPSQVLSVLRGFLKQPTFSSEVRDLLSKFIPHAAERGVSTIPTLERITGVRKAQDRNSYLHFYEERIDDATAEKLIKTYGEIATGIALLLREEDRLCVLDFDDRQVLIDLLNQLGYPCNENNLEEVVLHVFSQNPIVATYRGFHVYGFDPDLVEAVMTRKDLGKIEVRVSHCYVVLPPSLAGFEPQGATLNLVYYRQVRPLLPETIRAPLPTQIRDYFLAQIRPQKVSANLSFTPVTQVVDCDLKNFVIDTFVSYWRKGMRDELTYPLAGVLRRAGFSLNEAIEIISEICDKAGDEEKKDRLYQVRRQYSLPLSPNGNSPFCAGIAKLRENCLAAGMPLQTFQILISRLFGFKLTADLEIWLKDNKQIAAKVAEMLRPTVVFNTKTRSWWVFDQDELRWVRVDNKEIIHFVARALYEVRNDIEEVIKLNNNGSIPTGYIQRLNSLLNAQNIRNNFLEMLAIMLSVNFHFPHIPEDIAATLPAEVTRITGHRNGVLLWLKNGDTVFYPIKPNEPEPHRIFFVTHTANSIVDDCADPTPFIDYLVDLVDDKETAHYLLQVMASVLGLRKNIFRRLIILLGGGRNGKTTFMEVVKAAFGDLVQTTSSKLLLGNSNDNSVLSGRANLRNCAFAVVDEAPPPKLWDIETVKNLTGSEEIIVKELYKNVETIPVTWVYIILTNNYPNKFKQQDHATADRLITILFPKRFSDKVKKEGRYLRRKDDAKIEALKENTAAIIQAFRLAFKEAAAKNFILEEPEKVKEVTDPIRQRADTIGYFLDACTEEDAGAAVSISALYQAYKKFVEEEDLGSPLSQRAFKDYLMTNNFKKQKINGLIHIVGLRLKNDGQPTPIGGLTDDDDSNGDGNGQPPDPADQDYLDQFPF